MNVKETIAINIKRLRKIMGYTQSDLAELVGVDASTIGKIESGIQFPRTDTIDKLANALNVDYEVLFKNNANVSENTNDILTSLMLLLKSYSDKKLKNLYHFLNDK